MRHATLAAAGSLLVVLAFVAKGPAPSGKVHAPSDRAGWIRPVSAALLAQRQASPFARGLTLEKPPVPKDDFERRVLAVIAELERGPWYANVPQRDGRFLRQIAEAMNAQYVVEIGTSSGYSGLWLALALKRTGGKLYTHEIDPERIRLAERTFRKAGVDEIIEIVPGDAHQTILQHKGPIDLVFIDADKPGYPDYLRKLLPRVRPGGVILGHNMRRPAPSPEYVRLVTTLPELETTFLFMDAAGMAFSIKKR